MHVDHVDFAIVPLFVSPHNVEKYNFGSHGSEKSTHKRTGWCGNLRKYSFFLGKAVQNRLHCVVHKHTNVVLHLHWQHLICIKFISSSTSNMNLMVEMAKKSHIITQVIYGLPPFVWGMIVPPRGNGRFDSAFISVDMVVPKPR